ncbi:type II secretion system protein [candidate division WWE3 bacterium]|jgi:prepilin-type N-terminal cleavage/methylation domain-containing protein|uniref:Type II secretion system protein n=1 Tax=candidate division WWE3 bacterium TaxID=2053526 RepID=A0A3A4ZDU9_UNCKA|nr:MAG: type II secretion system protein [candidate division WWE3 bacterium]
MYQRFLHTSKKYNSGFTMIELLITAMVIAILSGATASIINYQRHRLRTDDSVRRATLQKLVDVVETYRTTENLYPLDPNSDGNPEDDPVINTYLVDVWPNNEPAGAIYTYWVDAARRTIGITVNASDNRDYKYRTAWGQIRECDSSAVPSDNLCP